MAQHRMHDPTRTPEAADAGFGVRRVALLLGTTPARVRGWVRSGLVQPQRDARGALRFSFRDLSFMRQLRALERRRIAPRRVRQVVRRLRDAGTAGLASVQLDATRGDLVLRDGATLWSPESGQVVFDFTPRPAAATVVALGARRTAAPADAGTPGAHEWYCVGAALEPRDPERAREAYLRALSLDPGHADAATDLGCLVHDRGQLDEAERYYRAALDARPDATGWFNLAVVLEDQKRDAEARRAYEQAIAADSACAEAHFNLARLCERTGDRAAALRHLNAYRGLST